MNFNALVDIAISPNLTSQLATQLINESPSSSDDPDSVDVNKILITPFLQNESITFLLEVILG